MSCMRRQSGVAGAAATNFNEAISRYMLSHMQKSDLELVLIMLWRSMARKEDAAAGVALASTLPGARFAQL